MSSTTSELKSIVLGETHEKLGAKMVPFAGFYMPVQYAGVNEEHLTVRENVGVFDVSHMGEFMITGEKALDLIQFITSNDASKLVDEKIQYSCFPNNDGGIVDDLLVYRINEEKYMLVVNGANIEKDWKWVNDNNSFGAKVEDISENASLFAVQGPNSCEALQSLTDINLEEMVYYTFKIGTFAGIENVIVSATGYTGSGGFEIYVKNKDAKKVWDAIFESGADLDIKPIGLAARDTLRLEMGFCLYGNDINDTTSPIEAGLGWITKFTKNFINDANLKSQKENGITKKLVGFIIEDKGIARQGYDILNEAGDVIGNVTSGTMSPSLKQAIGMGYVEKSFSKADSEIYIAVRKKKLKAKVVKFPFYKG